VLCAAALLQLSKHSENRLVLLVDATEVTDSVETEERKSSSTQIQIPAGTMLAGDMTTSSCSPPWLFPEHGNFSCVKMPLVGLLC